MARLLIKGGKPLIGDVEVSGSKNSSQALLAAAALADGECVLENISRGTATATMCLILRQLGARVFVDNAGNVHVDGTSINRCEAPYELVRRERGSFYVAGLLLSRLGQAEVPLPGGCDIGPRPIDFHIRGFQQLGAQVNIEHGSLVATANKMNGTSIFVGRSSVGATVNLMLAACKANGITVLENAAKEPEIVDLAIFLNSMGARVRGAGTDVIRIEGVERLSPAQHTTIPDRIEAGTFMMCTAITGGNVHIRNAEPEHLRLPILKLVEAGVQVIQDEGGVIIKSEGRLKACDAETAPYPGFPTDFQQPFVSVMSIADGTSVIRETIFENRWRWADELRRLGADIRVERDTAIIKGVNNLTGAPVQATDLRAGAALVVAALAASGETAIYDADVIYRGYEHLSKKLNSLGACISEDFSDTEENMSFWQLTEELDRC